MSIGKQAYVVAEYFLKHASESGKYLTPMQVLKLVYIAHGWMLGIYRRPLVVEDIEAWQYGPVIPALYQTYKKFGGNLITDIPTMYPKVDKDEATIMDQVWDGYGDWSGVSLSSLTHEKGSPWFTTVRQSGLGSVISDDLIEDYYSRLADQ